MRRALARLLTAICTAAIVSAVLPVHGQHAVIRMKGRVLTERGEPIPDAELRSEAFYGYAAGTFAGQRTFNVRSNARGEWSFVGLQPGIWLFEVLAPRYLPETVVLPITGPEPLEVTTLRKPKVFSCEVSQASPSPGVAGVILVKEPE